MNILNPHNPKAPVGRDALIPPKTICLSPMKRRLEGKPPYETEGTFTKDDERSDGGVAPYV